MDEKEYSFRVTISDETSKSYEPYNLKVKVSGLTLCDAMTDELILDWPFQRIRRFFRTDSSLIIETGRAAVSGDGKFAFNTPEPLIIYNRISENIEKLRQVLPGKVKVEERKAEEVSPPTSKDEDEYTEPYNWVQPHKEKAVQRSQTYSPKSSPVLPSSRVHRSHSQTNQRLKRHEDKEMVFIAGGCVKISEKDPSPSPCEQRYTSMPPEGQRSDEGHSYLQLNKTQESDSCYITPVPHSVESPCTK